MKQIETCVSTVYQQEMNGKVSYSKYNLFGRHHFDSSLPETVKSLLALKQFYIFMRTEMVIHGSRSKQIVRAELSYQSIGRNRGL